MGKEIMSVIHRLKRRLLGPPKMERAQSYVGTDEVSGRLQLDLLLREGLKPDHDLLEIGCGSLNLAVHLFGYLQPKRYVGIDPNPWLRNTAIRKRRLAKSVERGLPTFLSNSDFDATALGRTFDFCFSHSILSHAAHWQLGQFLQNTARVTKSGGKIIASIRLAEGNKFGSTGSKDKQDSRDEQWVYPGVSWFSRSTIDQTAAKHGLRTILKPEYTEYYTRTRPAEVHDWFIFLRV
jgi:cyclopropane fatty-acyl-phospholipid synthase-like methyltransferase